MSKWEDEIKRYHNGEMSPEEQHALEKKALRDPFLYEALEGTEHISEVDFSNDLHELTTRLKERTEQSEVLIAAEASAMKAASPAFADKELIPEGKNKSWWVWPLRIAASVAILLIAYFIIPNFTQEDKQVAQQVGKPSTPVPEKTTDSMLEQPKDLIVMNEAKPAESAQTNKLKAIESVKPAEQDLDQPAGAGRADTTKTEEIAKEEEIAKDEVANVISESPVLAAEPRIAEYKKESGLENIRAKSIVQNLQSNQRVIQGQVLSAEDGTPLPGVNIVVKGTTNGTVTDMQGNYQLLSDSQEPTLVYSFIGLQTQEVKAPDQGEVNVTLQSDISQLSEVVVTGYSAAKTDANHEPIVKLAEPAGGRRAYDKYLKNSLQYPQQALENQIKGRVTVQFTVRTDGSIDEFNVLKSLGYGCDEEVIRLVKEGPKWSPTTEDNVAVESEVRVRVKFAPPD